VLWRKSRKSILSRAAVFLEKPWAIFLLWIPISIIEILTDRFHWRSSGLWSYYSLLLCFIFGYMIFSNKSILENIKNYWIVFIIIAVAGSVYALTGIYVNKWLSSGISTPFYFWIFSCKGIGPISWIIGLTGFCMRFLNFRNRFLNYANEAVLPFYILHHLVIIVLGYFIVQWKTGISIKFIATVILSLTAIIIIYEFLVRRFNIMRVLFGMKPKKSQ
ncbi:MAG: hypothetical protein JW737_07625, partial [Acidobacteria bacterium]|nr:hypothetical protein [Acidobacteriota bacterium]